MSKRKLAILLSTLTFYIIHLCVTDFTGAAIDFYISVAEGIDRILKANLS